MNLDEWVQNELYQELLEMPLWVASAFSTKENDKVVFILDEVRIRLVHYLICKWVDKAPFDKINKINYKSHYDIEKYKPLLRQALVKTIQIEEVTEDDYQTIFVTNIICKACKNELPRMTLREHLDGKGCPCRQ